MKNYCFIRSRNSNDSEAGSTQVVYIDRLGLFVGLQLIVYSTYKNIVQIRYLSIDRFGSWIIAIVRRLRLCTEVEKIEFDFSSDGLWYWVQDSVEDVSKNIAAKLFENGTFMEHISEKIEPARRTAVVRRSLAIDLYRPMILSFLAQKETFTNFNLPDKVVMFNFSDLLPLFVKASEPWIRGVKFFNLLNFKKSFATRLVWFLGSQWLVTVEAILEVLKSNSKKKNSVKATVAIQYVWGTEKNQRMNDLWWFDEMPHKYKYRCLMFFNHPRGPATDQSIKDVEVAGCQFRILKQAVNRTANYETDRYATWMLRHVAADCFTLLKLFCWAVSASAPFWQMTRWMGVILKTRQWQTFMEAENVKVIFDTVESSLDTASLAADIVGAVKLGMHWGNYAVPYARLTPVHQVQFLWGSRFQSIMEAMGAVAEVFIQAGCIYDNGKERPKWRENAESLRRSIKKTGVKQIVCVLDKSCGPESLSPPAHHIEFYEKLLSWAEHDQQIGLIIKPKIKGPGVLAYKPELNDYLQKMVSTGRVVLLSGDRHVAEAALASDLVAALGLNSAGVLSALEEVPTIFWDPSFGTKGPLEHWIDNFDWNNGKFVFGTMDNLINAAKNYLNGNSPILGLDALANMMNEIDSFRDGRTATRIGSFVQCFLEGIDHGLNRDDVLKISTQKYRSEWGTDKVCLKLK